MELQGKVALVTGGARRVGRALTLALARAGADVVIDHRRSDEEAEATAAEARAIGRQVLVVRADVAATEDRRRLVEAVRDRFGRLDVLVNSASRFDAADVEAITEAEWDAVLGVNLKAPFFLTQAAAPLLRADGGGVVVNIADLSALQPWRRYAHHAVSKAGLVHLTRVLARALAPAIRVNAIAPGTVLPPEDFGAAETEAAARRAVLGRIGSPEDVAGALLYLVGAEFVTGEVLVVDGGRLLGG